MFATTYEVVINIIINGDLRSLPDVEFTSPKASKSGLSKALFKYSL